MRFTYSAVCALDFLQGSCHTLNEGDMNFFHRGSYAWKYLNDVGPSTLEGGIDLFMKPKTDRNK